MTKIENFKHDLERIFKHFNYKTEIAITEIKNSLDELHRSGIAEKTGNKQKDGPEENLSNEAWREIQDIVTTSRMFVFGVPQERRELGRSNI